MAKDLKELFGIDRYELLLKVFNMFIYTSKIPKKEAKNFIDVATKYGEEKAIEIKSRFEQYQAQQICDELKVSVCCKAKLAGDDKFVKMAEFEAKKKNINLNLAAIDVVNRCLSQEKRTPNAKDILIFHELFHYFEYYEWGSYAKMHKYTAKYGCFKIERDLLPMSELASNAFVKEMMQLDFEPILIEKLYFRGINRRK